MSNSFLELNFNRSVTIISGITWLGKERKLCSTPPTPVNGATPVPLDNNLIVVFSAIDVVTGAGSTYNLQGLAAVTVKMVSVCDPVPVMDNRSPCWYPEPKGHSCWHAGSPKGQ